MINTLKVIGWNHDITIGERDAIKKSLANSPIGHPIKEIIFIQKIIELDPPCYDTIIGTESYDINKLYEKVRPQNGEGILVLTENNLHNYEYRVFPEGGSWYPVSITEISDGKRKIAIGKVNGEYPFNYLVLHGLGNIQGLNNCSSPFWRNGNCLMSKVASDIRNKFTLDLCIACQNKFYDFYHSNKKLEEVVQ